MRHYTWTAEREVTEHIVVQHIDEMTGKLTGLVTVEKVEKPVMAKPVMAKEEVPAHQHRPHWKHHDIHHHLT